MTPSGLIVEPILCQLEAELMKEYLPNRLYHVPSIKYVKLEGEGVREGVTVCDRVGRSKSM